MSAEEVQSRQFGGGAETQEVEHAWEEDGGAGTGWGEGLELSEKGNYRVFAVV